MMLIAPMLQQGVAVSLPEAGNTEPKPDTQDQTVVAIDSANQFWVNGLQFSKTEFATRVKAALEDKKEKVVLIKGDKDAKYSAIMPRKRSAASNLAENCSTRKRSDTDST